MLRYLFANISPLQTLTKNSFWIVFGRVAAGVLRAGLTILAARTLGVAGFGSFTLAMNFVLIFSFLPEFGFTAILTRELAKRQGDPHRTFSALFSLTLVCSLIAYALLILISPLAIRDPRALAVVPILGIMMLLDVLREFTYGVFRAEERMQIQGIQHTLTNLLLFGLGAAILTLNPSLPLLAIAYLTAVGAGAIIGVIAARRYFSHITLSFDPSVIRHFFTAAWPIALANFLFLLLLYLDSVILGWFHPPAIVGLYGATVKFTEFLIFFPQAIALAVFPMFSRSLNDPVQLRRYLELSLRLGFLLTVPIAAGGFVLGGTIVPFIFGPAYAAAAPAFRIIVISLLGTAPFLILTNLLVALDQRRDLLRFDFALVVINAVANLLTVPHFHYYAAAYNTVLTSLLGLVFAHHISRRHVSYALEPLAAKPLGAAVLMGLLLWPVRGFTPLLTVPLGVLIYLIALIVSREEVTTKVITILRFRPRFLPL